MSDMNENIAEVSLPGPPSTAALLIFRTGLTSDVLLQHTRLVSELESLDYAPPTLKQVQAQLDSVSKKLADDQKQLKKLESATLVVSNSISRT